MLGDYNVVNLKEYLSGTRGDIVTGTTKAVRLVDLFTKERLTQYEESRKQFDKMNSTFAMHPDRVLIPYYYIQDYVDRELFEELAKQAREFFDEGKEGDGPEVEEVDEEKEGEAEQKMTKQVNEVS